MNGRESLETIFAGGVPDRFRHSPIGAWRETRERWETEGLPAGEDHNVVLGLRPADDVVRFAERYRAWRARPSGQSAPDNVLHEE